MSMVAKKPRAKPSLSKVKLRLWLRLLRTTREIETEVREQLRVTFDTTLPRFDVMAALARQERGMTMTALSRHLLVSNGNVTGIVDRLVQDGLVMRATDSKDRRTTFVRLTAAGAAAFDTMAVAHEGWVAARLNSLSADEAETLHALLTRASSVHEKETSP